MYTEKTTNEFCVEVYASNNKGATMIIRKIIGEAGVHETYMKIYDKLINMGKDAEWKVKSFRVRSIKSVYYNASKEKEV